MIKYYICGLYDMFHEINGKEVVWATQRFLAKSSDGIYFYPDKPEEKCLCFDTEEDANKYIDEHNLRNGLGCNVHSHFVVMVEEW